MARMKRWTESDVEKMHAFVGRADFGSGARNGASTVDDFMITVAGEAAQFDGYEGEEIRIYDKHGKLVASGIVGEPVNVSSSFKVV